MYPVYGAGRGNISIGAPYQKVGSALFESAVDPELRIP